MFKKIILIIIAIMVVGTGYLAYQLKIETQKLAVEKKTVLDHKNCTYFIEDKSITLINGYSELEILPGSASKLITRYFGNETIGDFNGDGFSDVVFLLTQESSGSGTFYYAAVALGSENGCKGTSAILLGDRIAPQTTEFREGEIIINYADRQPGEPMTASPSVGVSKYLKIIEGQLVDDETADWQVYKDEEYGFKMKYPTGFFQTESLGPKTKVLSCDYVNFPDKCPFIPINGFTLSEEEAANSQFIKTERIIVNNYPFCLQASSEGAMGTSYATYNYTTVRDKKCFVVYFTVGYPHCSNYLSSAPGSQERYDKCTLANEVSKPETINKILSTFKFIE